MRSERFNHYTIAPMICGVATIVCNSCERIAENARRGVVDKLLYADDHVLMSKTMEDFKKIFWNWKDALESKGLKVNTKKNKSDGKCVGRRTIQKQDRSMWSMWEENHGQFNVVHKMWKLGSWQMCKNKESYH